MDPFLADLQAQGADFYLVKLHLQEEYVLYRKFKKIPECSNGFVLQYICHCGLQQQNDQTQSACRKHSLNPHEPVKARFSTDIVQQQNKGSLLNLSVLTTI